MKLEQENINKTLETYGQKLASNLKNLMHASEIKEKDLVVSTGVKRTTLWTMLNCDVDPRLSSLLPIAEYFDISIDQLIGREEIDFNAIKRISKKNIPVIKLSEAEKYLGDPINTAVLNWVTVNKTEHDVHFAVRSTKSYEPYFRDGTILIVESRADYEDGNIILMSDGTNSTIRQIFVDGKFKNLKSLDGSQSEIMLPEHRVLGIVVEERFLF